MKAGMKARDRTPAYIQGEIRKHEQMVAYGKRMLDIFQRLTKEVPYQSPIAKAKKGKSAT